MINQDRIVQCFLSQPGEQPATIDFHGTVWSFDQVLGRALAVAGRLQDRAQVAGRVVLLRTGPTPMFSVVDLAVLLAGGVPAVLPNLTRQQLAAVWRVLDPVAVIDTTTAAAGSGPLADTVRRTGTPLLPVDEIGCRPTGTPVQWRAVARRRAAARLEQAAAVVFTSGTTGTPRSAVLGDAALVRGVRAWNAQWNHRPRRTLAYLPVSHVAQRIMGHTLMCLYGTTVMASTPDRVIEDLVTYRPDTLLGVPQVWARLAANTHDADLRSALSGVHAAVNGAATLDRTVAADLKRHTGLRIMGAYGATETTTPAFHQPDATQPGLGRPVGVDFRLTAEGELQLHGPNLATGYVDCWPHLRPVTDRDGWLRTGDLVHTADDGELHFAGRLTSSFKTARGEMITPEPVEAHLLTHPDVTAACLLGPGLSQAVALVCAPRTATWSPQRIAALEDDLLTRAEEARRRGELPWSDLAAVRILPDSWPDLGLVTSTGKPCRTAIADHYRHLLTFPERTRVPA